MAGDARVLRQAAAQQHLEFAGGRGGPGENEDGERLLGRAVDRAFRRQRPQIIEPEASADNRRGDRVGGSAFIQQRRNEKGDCLVDEHRGEENRAGKNADRAAADMPKKERRAKRGCVSARCCNRHFEPPL
jgi:hypothetical protein